MRKNQIRKTIGYLLIGISFLLFAILDSAAGGKNVFVYFVAGIILFFIGTFLKKNGSYHWKENLKGACAVVIGVGIADLFLKWIMNNEISLTALRMTGGSMVQDAPGLFYLWLSVFFYQSEKEPLSSGFSFIAAIGDSLPVLLSAHLFVSDLPVYWQGSHPVILHTFMDFFLCMIFMIMMDTDGVSHRGIIPEIQNSSVHQKLLSLLSEFNLKTKKIQNALYFICLGLLFFYYFLNTTTFPEYIASKAPEAASLMEKGCLALLGLVTLLAVFSLYDADSKGEKIWSRIALLLGVVFYANSQFGALTAFLMLLCCGVKKDADKVLKLAFSIGILMLLVSWICAEKGIISDIVVDNNHGLGIIYSTDCFAHWFYLFAMYCLIRKGKFQWFEYLITLALILYIYRLTGAETSLICMILLWGVMLMHQYVIPHIRKHPVHLQNILVYSYWFFAAVYIIAVKEINRLTPLLQVRFHSLWQRLFYGQTALVKYKMRFLFQSIEEHGNGNLDYTRHTFFYLDDSYIRILLMYGILMFLFIMILMTWFLKKSEKNQYGILFAILVIIALHSVLEQRLPEFWYNIFLTLPLADFRSLKGNHGIEEL